MKSLYSITLYISGTWNPKWVGSTDRPLYFSSTKESPRLSSTGGAGIARGSARLLDENATTTSHCTGPNITCHSYIKTQLMQTANAVRI